MISERSSSAIAEMITTTARPIAPAVSKLSLKLRNSTLILVSSSSTSKKVLRVSSQAIATPDQQNVESTATSVGHHLIEPGPPSPGSTDAMVAVLLHDLEAALLGDYLESAFLFQWRLDEEGI